MLRDWDHTEVRSLSWWLLLWKLKIGWNHICLSISCLESSLHDDLVHGSGKVLVDLVHDACSIDVLSRLKISGGSGHVDDSADLLWVEFRKLLSWHVVDEEVVSDLRVSIDSLLMSLGNSLGEDSWIFRVEKEVDSSKFEVLTSHIPVTAINGSLLIPGFNQEWFPLMDTILILESLSWNRSEVTFFIGSELNPLMREAAVVFEIIEWLKREPFSWILLTSASSVVDSELKKELFDIKRGKELSLSINNNLSWWLSRNWKEWLHDLGIWISHSFSLSRVEALVDIGVSEVVFANNFDIFLQSSQVFVNFFDRFRFLLLQPSGPWDLLLGVGLDQTGVLWTNCRNKPEILGILGG